MKRYSNIILYFSFVLVILTIFELAVREKYVSSYIFASPTQITKRFWEMSFDGSLWGNVFTTLKLALISTFLGFILGAMIAMLMVRLKRWQSFFEFALDFLRSIPLTTLIPVFIVMYGIGSGPKVAIGSISALLTSALTIFLGLKELALNRRDYIFLFEPSWKDTILDIYFRDGSVYYFTAFRLSISIALVLVIVSEMFIGTESGLGKMVMDKTYTDDRAGQFAIILLSGVIGWSLNKLTLIIQNRFANE